MSTKTDIEDLRVLAVMGVTDAPFASGRRLYPQECQWLGALEGSVGLTPKEVGRLLDALHDPDGVAREVFHAGRRLESRHRIVSDRLLGEAQQTRAREHGEACCQGAGEAEGLRVENGRLEFILYDGHDSAAHVWAPCVACPLCGARWQS